MTKENAKEYLHFVQALTEGKTIQILDSDTWIDINDPVFSIPPDNYRIKPESKLRAWKPNEIPLIGHLRHTNSSQAHSYGVDQHTGVIWFTNCNGNTQTYANDILFSMFEHSSDGGKTWNPCGVKE